MQRGPYPDVPPDFGHWLAGFIDGEGCFSVTTNGGRHRTRKSVRCLFRIALRNDDTPMLVECRERTGLGTIYQQRAVTKTRNGKPSVMWHVSHKSDTGRLVEVLDRYPLRSKKARDYAIWRKAVLIRNGRRRPPVWGGHDATLVAELEALRVQLIEGRKWRDHCSVLVPEPFEADPIAARCDLRLF